MNANNDKQNGSRPLNLFPQMMFRLISLYMGSPLLRIYAIIYDRVFPRFPSPGHKRQYCSFLLVMRSRSQFQQYRNRNGEILSRGGNLKKGSLVIN